MKPICGITSRGFPRSRPGSAAHPASWSISEVGDGNLNLVFIVKGHAGGIAVKQALPYVRLVGESWPLPLSRSHYEYLALTHQARLAPGLVPAVLHHNEALAPGRHGVDRAAHHHAQGADCRHALSALRRRTSPTFLARTLFFSSDLALPAAKKKERDRGVRRQPCAVQDHRGPDLHRSLSRGRAEPLDAALARRDGGRVPGRPRPARRDLARSSSSS